MLKELVETECKGAEFSEAETVHGFVVLESTVIKM